MHQPPIAVIGGGLTGALTALLLADAGKSVVLFDHRSPYAASDHNPGGINPLHGPAIGQGYADLYSQAFERHQELQQRLAPQQHAAPWLYRTIDRLFLAFTEAEEAELEAMAPRYDRAGFSASLLKPDQIAARDPRLSREARRGLWTHGNVTVDAPVYAASIRQAALAHGVRWQPERVERLLVDGERVRAVVTTQQSLVVSAVVVAAGCWSQELLDPLGVCAGLLQPVKGEMLLLELPASQALTFDVTHGLRGFYQHRDHQYWLGGTRSDPAQAAGPTEAGGDHILSGIRRMLPGLPLQAGSIVAHTAGYRPSTADGLPVVGPVAPYDNLVLAGGGGSKGVLLSSWLATMASRLLAGGSPDIPDRFLPRSAAA
ncbi:MAG: NAD(P)/FAD-dependent oxidoreductase [Cyanobium sp.]